VRSLAARRSNKGTRWFQPKHFVMLRWLHDGFALT
jgi:hypothetical protein